MKTEEICKKYEIENYTINNDGSIDVNGDVFLYDKKLTELPLIFNKVYGDFDCTKNNLISLKGGPRWVDGSFYCFDNYLTSLEFSPDYVGDDFSCRGNYLTDLVGSSKEVGGDFYCHDNPNLINPKGCSEKIGGDFYCYGAPIGSIFNNVDQFFLHAFNFYKVIKDDTVNLKRLKYVMDLYDKRIDLKSIENHYKII